MNRLANISLHAWYLFSVAYCYCLWNPYYSLFDFARGGADPAIKAIAIVMAVIVAAMYLVEGHKSLNGFAIGLFLALTGALLWFGFNQGVRYAYVDYWAQWIVGGMLTLALQGGRMYRALTGRVPVGTGNTDEHNASHHS